MKNMCLFLRMMLFAGCALAFSLQAQSQSPLELVSDRDFQLLDSAVYLMDNGQPEVALKMLDGLCKKYPDNYVMNYERLFACYKKGDYKRVVKDGKKLFNYPDASSLCYHLVGNALDYMKKTDEALAIYDEGIKRFPDSGNLYLEKGNIYASSQLYGEAIDCYSKGVEVDPTFPSNYYWLAKLYAMSTEPLWGILYGEVAYNIDPNRSHATEISKIIYDLFVENVKLSGDSGKVTLTKRNTVIIDTIEHNVFIPFELSYEVGISKALPAIIQDKGEQGSLSIMQIAELRKSAVDFIDTVASGRYNVSIVDFHRKLIESGNWLPYNMWLLRYGAPQEYQAWADSAEGEAQYMQFLEWMEDNHFVPSIEHPTLLSLSEKRQVLKIPSLSDISTPQGCREHREDALRLSKWLLEQPLDPKDINYQDVRRFLIVWMTNTDECSFMVMGNSIGNVELFAAYMAAMTEHAIDFNMSTTDESMYCEVMLQVIDYYKRNKGVIGQLASMEEFLKMDGATLHDVLAKEYQESIKEAEQQKQSAP